MPELTFSTSSPPIRAPRMTPPPTRMRTDVKECPHCNEKIEYLKYERTGITEYGEAELDGNDTETNDSCYDNTDITYTCPECEAEVDPEDLKDVPEERQEERPQTQTTETAPPIRFTSGQNQNPDPEQQNQEPQPHIENFHGSTFSPEGPNRYVPNRPEVPTFLKCPKCHELTEPTLSKERNDHYNHCFNGQDEIEVKCWNCGKKLNKKHKIDTNKLT